MATTKCPQISHLAGSATTNVAWHGLGVVTPGTLPAREAFETADALFSVEKRELLYPRAELPYLTEPAGVFGVIRTDTQQLLGVVTKQYEIVQNDSLLTHGGVHP